jgi:hypothetical protein
MAVQQAVVVCSFLFYSGEGSETTNPYLNLYHGCDMLNETERGHIFMDFTKYRDFLAQTTPKYLQIQQAVDRAVRKAKRIRALLYPVYFLCLALALYSVYVSNFCITVFEPNKSV